MKRLLTLVLCLCFALSGCAQSGTMQHTEEGGGVMPAPSVTPVPDTAPAPDAAPTPAESFETLAVRLAALPELPPQPDIDELWKAMNSLDYNALGAEKYEEAWKTLRDEFDARQQAYDEALNELRGAGVDKRHTPSFAAYTLRTAQELLKQAAEENVVYSPANLYLALCMLAETTNGGSRAQLLDLLGLDSVEQARSAARSLWHSLYNDGSAGRTLPANSIWLNEQFTFHEDTVDTLADEYCVSTFRAPMGVRTTDAAIAQWINANTNGLLAEAAEALETKPETLMMLISTLYFKGTWRDQFAAHNTSKDMFTSAKGEKQRIDFMHKTENGSYYRHDGSSGFTAASLPFRDGTSMWFLLPDEGVNVQSLVPDVRNLSLCIDAEAGLIQNTAFGPIEAKQGYGEIRWSVPKFDVDSSLDLIPQLEALGVTDIFDADAADFSALTDLDAVVSAVQHSARVKVDEEGCEAAAFTAVMAEATAMMPEQLPVVEMNLNRPFGFLITGADGLPLFLSIVNTVR